MIGCGRCHTCATELRVMASRAGWCRYCKTYRYYHSHGWVPLFQLSIDEQTECPTEERLAELKARLSRKRGKKYNKGKGNMVPLGEKL